MSKSMTMSMVSVQIDDPQINDHQYIPLRWPPNCTTFI